MRAIPEQGVLEWISTSAIWKRWMDRPTPQGTMSEYRWDCLDLWTSRLEEILLARVAARPKDRDSVDQRIIRELEE